MLRVIQHRRQGKARGEDRDQRQRGGERPYGRVEMKIRAEGDGTDGRHCDRNIRVAMDKERGEAEADSATCQGKNRAFFQEVEDKAGALRTKGEFDGGFLAAPDNDSEEKICDVGTGYQENEKRDEHQHAQHQASGGDAVGWKEGRAQNGDCSVLVVLWISSRELARERGHLSLRLAEANAWLETSGEDKRADRAVGFPVRLRVRFRHQGDEVAIDPKK
jgi:hypothetical protein